MNRTFLNVLNLKCFEFVAVTFCICIPLCGSLRNEICSKFHVDVKKGGGGGGSDLKRGTLEYVDDP